MKSKVTSKIRAAFAIIILIVLLVLGWYYYNLYSVQPSFVMVYPSGTKPNKIENDINVLLKKRYRFISLKRLNELLQSKKSVSPMTAVVAINNLPTNEILTFFKNKNIPATFFISPPESILAKNIKNVDFGLRPQFPTPKPKTFKDGYVSIAFDDGWRSVYENGLPVLKKARLPASMYVIAEPIIDGSSRYMTQDQVSELQDEGWEIGSHSFSHEHFNKINYKEAEFSFAASKGFLEGLGIYSTGFAFPFGEYKASTLTIAQKYFKYFRFSENRYDPPDNRQVIDGFILNIETPLEEVKQRLNWAKSHKAGLVFVFHEVSDNGRRYAITAEKLEQIVKMIKKSGLPIHSIMGIIQKPLFLKQENGITIESQTRYIERIRRIFKAQKGQLARNGIDTNIFLYPEGVVTDGLEKAAGHEGLKIGLTGKTGYINGHQNPLDLKTLILKERPVESILYDSGGQALQH